MTDPGAPNWPPPWPSSAAPARGAPGRRGEAEGTLAAPGQPPSGDQDDRPYLPAAAAWWAVPGALVALVLASIGSAVGEALTNSQTSATTDLLGELGLWAAMLGTALLVSRRYGTGHLRDFGVAFRPSDLVWGGLALLGALAVTQVVLLAFEGTKFAGSNVQIIAQQKGHAAGIVVVGVLVAVGAPFFEELFFRGYLRATLSARLGTHGGVWAQAAIFGLAHFGESSTMLGNVSVVLAMLGVGAVLGYAAKLTGRLGAGMVAHCLFNLLAVVSVV